MDVLPPGWEDWTPTQKERLLTGLQTAADERVKPHWYCDRDGCDGQPHPDRPYPHARWQQVAPPGDWQTLLLLAGRGFGKTRTGAEWSHRQARLLPRGALVAPTNADIRDVMVEGESGILATARPLFRPTYEPSKRRVTWPNGHIATTYSAEEPDRLRGPQHGWAWCVAGDTPVTTLRGLVPIAAVTTKDQVLTRNGYRRVLAHRLTQRDAEVLEVRTSSGSVLRCTPNHKLFTNGAWCDAQKVKRGDTLLECLPTGAARSARYADATVSSVRSSGFSDVYDLTVEGEHEFFAGGLLVHNCDELAAWKELDGTLDNLLLGLRLGAAPQILATTTPRPRPRIRALVKDPATLTVRGSTYDNLGNLAPTFRTQVLAKYEGTRLGRQELLAELLEDVEGALWSQAMIDADRIAAADMPLLTRIVVAIDPAVTSGEDADETGIIVAGTNHTGHVYVLEDLTCRVSPQQWVKIAVGAYTDYQADRIIAEANNGGDMVEAILRSQGGHGVAYKKVTASRGKRVRAEPISALYEQHRVHHVGLFPALEDQMVTWVPLASDGSPDRMDALVWAVTELAVEPQRKKGAWSL